MPLLLFLLLPLASRTALAAPPVSPHNYSFGSGSFGQWKEDRFGLPCTQSLSVNPNLHQVGNDRLIGMAKADGSLSIRQDEGGPQWLQAVEPAVGQHGGALGYLQ